VEPGYWKFDSELASTDGVWKVGLVGDRIAAVFSKNNKVIFEVITYSYISSSPLANLC